MILTTNEFHGQMNKDNFMKIVVIINRDNGNYE